MEGLKELFKFKNKYLEGLFTLFIIFTLSSLIMVITFIFASAIWNMQMPIFRSYFNSFSLLAMNFIPIFLFMIILYLAFNKLWLSFALSSGLFVTLSIINKFKLTYRDDPFSFIDIKLIKESLEMKGKYNIHLNRNMIILIIGLIIITIILKLLFDYKIEPRKLRLTTLGITILSAAIIFGKPYFNADLYNKIGDKTHINIWSESQQFQSKGFVYPFIYSLTSAKDTKLEGYNEKLAIDELSKMEYFDIPSDKKVNIIAIMLESYNDFSKFEGVDLGVDIYKNFHEIQKESYHGNLITNIFAGDTIQTERSFITGYYDHPKYFDKTNSFAWYFKKQGYNTKAMHPIYGWFYNRRNVNPYLGFDFYDYYENKYEAVQDEFFEDFEFFDFIIEDFEDNKSTDKPYFNFTVTYQNHGPYTDEKLTDVQYLKNKDYYNEETYNIINNYFDGINKTDIAIKKLVDYFRQEETPTIVLLFGDHNPWLGKDAVGYEMLGIDLDFGNIEGFKNYYETPYVIWGNDAAKKTLDRDFIGNGNDISPNFLMAEMFEYFGWKGNEYMQYLMNVKGHFDVMNKVYFKEDGAYTNILSLENQQIYKKFQNVEYYYSRNFKR